MRGFGMQFDLASGMARSWYANADGIQRWSDNDQRVDGMPEVADDENPTIKTKGNGNG